MILAYGFDELKILGKCSKRNKNANEMESLLFINLGKKTNYPLKINEYLRFKNKTPKLRGDIFIILAEELLILDLKVFRKNVINQ